MTEERRKAKEAAEKAAEAGENPIKAKAPQAPVSFPCTVTNHEKTDLFCVEAGDGLWKCNNPAVKKSANWGWKAVCQECDNFLKEKKAAEMAALAKKETEDKENTQENNSQENKTEESQ